MIILPSNIRSKFEQLLSIKPYDLRIITLSGENGSGKDTYAGAIKSLTGGKIIRFSQPVREDFEKAGISERELDVIKRTDLIFPDNTIIGGYDVSNLTTREALIKIAETNKSLFGQDYYTTILLGKIQSESPETFIIPDLRFEVEKNAIGKLKEQGALWIHFTIGSEYSNKAESPGNLGYSHTLDLPSITIL